MNVMNGNPMITRLYKEQAASWPASGRHILARHDAGSVYVYQGVLWRLPMSGYSGILTTIHSAGLCNAKRFSLDCGAKRWRAMDRKRSFP
jgi:hypothetical protein